MVTWLTVLPVHISRVTQKFPRTTWIQSKVLLYNGCRTPSRRISFHVLHVTQHYGGRRWWFVVGRCVRQVGQWSIVATCYLRKKWMLFNANKLSALTRKPNKMSPSPPLEQERPSLGWDVFAKAFRVRGPIGAICCHAQSARSKLSRRSAQTATTSSRGKHGNHCGLAFVKDQKSLVRGFLQLNQPECAILCLIMNGKIATAVNATETFQQETLMIWSHFDRYTSLWFRNVCHTG